MKKVKVKWKCKCGRKHEWKWAEYDALDAGKIATVEPAAARSTHHNQ